MKYTPIPLNKKQQEVKNSKWMAQEDINILFYVKQHGIRGY
jgi:hypothetical protein